MTPIYDPFEFISKIEIFTIAIIGSFITMKLLNSLYENIYEPCVDVMINSEKTDSYYISVGNYYIPAGLIIKEFIKWFLLLLILMIFYNVIMCKYFRKKN